MALQYFQSFDNIMPFCIGCTALYISLQGKNRNILRISTIKAQEMAAKCTYMYIHCVT